MSAAGGGVNDLRGGNYPMSMSIQAGSLNGAAPIMSGEEMYRLGLEASITSEESAADLVVAHKWFNLAAMQGHLEARTYRAELAIEMSQDEIAEAQRQAREYLMSNKPNPAY